MLALALALALGQALQPASPEGPIYSQPALMGTPWFQFAPPSGAGLPYAQNLCDVVAGDLTGSTTWCRDGNGMASGSTVSLNTVRGSASTSSATVCPSGPSCASKASMYVPTWGSDQGYTESANVDRNASVTSGGWTACWEGQVTLDSTGGERHLMSLSQSGSSWRYMLYWSPAGTVFRSYISSAACGAGTTTVSSGTAVQGGHHLFCVSWSATDGIHRLYLDGTANGTSAAYTTICGGGTNSRFSIGGYWNGSNIASSTHGHHFGGFFTEQQLSADRIAAIARAVLADQPYALVGGGAGNVSNTRASVFFCDSQGLGTTGSSGSIVPNNRACVTQGALNAVGSKQNMIPRSEEFNDASWVGINNTTATAVTANQGLSPTQTLTADRLTTGTCASSGLYSFIYMQTTSGAAGDYTGSVFLRGASGSGTVSVCVTDVGGGTGTCTPVSYVSTEARRFEVTHSVGATVAVRLEIGCLNLASRAGSSSTGAADVLVWGGQLEAGSFATAYMPTGSAAATRQADTPVVTVSGLTVDPSGLSWAATTTHPAGYAGSVWDAVVSLYQDANNRTQLYRGNTNTSPCSYFSGGGAANATAGSSTAHSAFVARTTYRRACLLSGLGAGSTVSNYLDGTLLNTSSTFTPVAITPTSIFLAGLSAGGGQDSLISNVCIALGRGCIR